MSKSQAHKLLKASGLIYSDSTSRLWHISSFEEIEEQGNSTKWCIALDSLEYENYAKLYDIYVFQDLSASTSSPFHKVCILVDVLRSFVVTSDNVHYYEGSQEFETFISSLPLQARDAIGL